MRCSALLASLILLVMAVEAASAADFPFVEDDFVIRDFRFKSGETLPELRLHFTTLGKPIRDEHGRITNAVMLLHGTGSSGRGTAPPQFADPLFAPGGILDAGRYYIILPDGIGHGKSSKPSDGLRARFPKYDYDDMVEAQYRLLRDKLGVEHLRLLLGISMGCMQAFIWGEDHPGFMDALMPLACYPTQVAGRNRVWRKLLMDAITTDPAWSGGDYKEQPIQGLRAAASLATLSGTAPLQLQAMLPTRDAADKYSADRIAAVVAGWDANDLLYQVNSSRNYDPSARLGEIVAPMTWINSADDFINPPELGIAEREVKKLKNAHFVLIPGTESTHGHSTVFWASLWEKDLAELLARSQR